MALAGCLVSAPALALTIFSENFEGGSIPAPITGPGAIVGTQGYSGLGFGSNLLQNSSASPPSATTLTLTGLPTHTSIDINFLLAIINSWDGDGQNDRFNVKVDGSSIFSETFASSGSGDSFVPDAGVVLQEDGSLFTQSGDNPVWRDAAYDMGQQGVFNNIAHTSSTLVIDFFASGPAWSGGADESFGLDNIEVVLNVATPEPASLGLLGLGFAALAMGRRRRSRAAR